MVTRCALLTALLAVVLLPRAAAADSPRLPQLGPAPNFVLTTQQNDRLWLTQLRDRVVVLTFTCTTCETCPGLLPSLFDLTRALGAAAGRRVFFVAVTVDPRRDTAPVLRRFARDRGADLTAWAFLTGSPAEVEVVSRWYGVEVRHEGARIVVRCPVTLIDGAGIVRARYAPEEIGRVPADVETLLGAGR